MCSDQFAYLGKSPVRLAESTGELIVHSCDDLASELRLHQHYLSNSAILHLSALSLSPSPSPSMYLLRLRSDGLVDVVPRSAARRRRALQQRRHGIRYHLLVLGFEKSNVLFSGLIMVY